MALTNNYWPNPSLGTLAGWTATRTPELRSNQSDAAAGVNYIRSTAESGDVNLAVWSTMDTTTMVGKQVSVGIAARSNVSTSRFLEVLLACSDSTGTIITQQVGVRVASAATWRTLTMDNMTIPAGTTRLLVQVAVRSSQAGASYAPATGDRLDVDALILSDGPTATEYRDGNSAGWVWLGEPNLSPSRQHVAMSATAYPTMSPVPRVELQVEGPTVAKVTLWRNVSGRESERVRGAIAVTATDAMNLTDYEAPFSEVGVQSSYRLELLSEDGLSLGYGPTATAVLAFKGTVIQQPLDPQRAVLVENASDRAPSRNRPFEGSYGRAPASTYGTWIGQGRHGLRDLPLRFRTYSEQDYTAMERVFGEAGETFSPVVCIRTSEWQMKLPNPLFVSVPNPNPVGIDWHRGGHQTEWTWRADEVTPPAPRVVVAAMSYDDLTAAYSTYTEFTNDNESYIGAARRFEFAGLT